MPPWGTEQYLWRWWACLCIYLSLTPRGRQRLRAIEWRMRRIV